MEPTRMSGEAILRHHGLFSVGGREAVAFDVMAYRHKTCETQRATVQPAALPGLAVLSGRPQLMPRPLGPTKKERDLQCLWIFS
jgi:hypothetical protein